MSEWAAHHIRIVWLMMTTMSSALIGALDLSAFGVRSSFRAILVALPALAVGWVGTSRLMLGADASADRMFALMAGVAVADLAAWIVPLLIFMPVLSILGLGPRYPAFLIATNWAGVIFAFIALPIGIARIFAPAAADMDMLLILVVLSVSLILYWRLLRATLGTGAGQTSALVILNMLIGTLSGYGVASLLSLPLGGS